jgi:uncharacterized protein
MKNKKISISIIIFFLSQVLMAQNGIVVTTRSQSSQVLIRWIPTDQNTWKDGIKNGYKIKRTLNKINGVSQSNQTPVFLNNGNVIKPLYNKSQWTTLFASSDSLINLSLKMDLDTTMYFTSPSKNLSAENWIELYQTNVATADLSYNGAIAMGLGFVDNSVVSGYTYNYEVSLASDLNVKGSELNPQVFSISPLKISTYQNVNERNILEWNGDTLQNNYFIKYDIERSLNTGAFIKINDIPITSVIYNTTGSGVTGLNKVAFSDTILVPRNTHNYRLKATTIFGEVSYSPTISIYVKEKLKFRPRITQSNFSGTNICLNWKFPADTIIAGYTNKITGFYVQKSNKAVGPYVNIAPMGTSNTLINKNDTTKCFSNMSGKYYLRIYANSLDNDSLISTPVYIMSVDSIKPNPPINISAVLGTDGIVNISWQKNTLDKDVYGYKVFKSNLLTEEPAEINTGVVQSLTYKDTLKNTDLNRSAYYKIDNKYSYYYLMAIDSSFNQSNLSAAIVLTKPDKTAPISPIIKSYKLIGKSVNLIWKVSPSKDILNHFLKRSKLNGLNSPPPYVWTNVSTFGNLNDTTYTDNSISSEGVYVYTLVAKDSASNESFSNFIFVEIKSNSFDKPTFSTFTGSFDEVGKFVSLNWVYTASGIENYLLYKKENTGSFTFYKNINKSTLNFKDNDVDFQSSMTYAIKAVFTDGTYSNLKEVVVNSPVKKTVNVDPVELYLKFNSAPLTVNLTSNTSWSISNIPNWLTLSFTSGNLSKSISINPQINSSNEPRYCVLNFIIATDTLQVYVYQAKEEIGTGLLGQYFGTPDLPLGKIMGAQVKRIDSEVKIGATSYGPIPGMAPDFSAIWEGSILIPTTGNYTFYVMGDDGAKLYINNTLKIEFDYGNNTYEYNTGSMFFNAGDKIPVRLEYWDRDQTAAIYLRWSNNQGISKQNIPTKYLFANYIPNADEQDPLSNKCFYLRDTQNWRYLEATENFTVMPNYLTEKMNQKWKLKKLENNIYKIATLKDDQEKVIQPIDSVFSNFIPVVQGYFNNKTNQKWKLVHQENNDFWLRTYNTNFGMNEISYYDIPKNVISESSTLTYKFIQTGCPSTNTNLVLDKREVVIPHGGGVGTVSIQTKSGWITEQSSNWFSINKTAGYGDFILQITAGLNDSGQIKQSYFKIISGNEIIQIKVTQN